MPAGEVDYRTEGSHTLRRHALVEPGAVAAVGSLRFSAADTGTGIAHEDLPHPFERFCKTAGPAASALGLVIARNRVLTHGGEIETESVAGRGPTIPFTFPI